MIDTDGQRLRLSPGVQVDLTDLLCHAEQLVAAPKVSDKLAICDRLVDALRLELLPDWSEDWLLLERERWQQVRLYTLEVLAKRLKTAEQYLPALQAAFTAISVEPIRETPHRIVIEIHIEEGNLGSALRHYHRYRGLLQRELSANPSPQMCKLVRDLTAAS